MWEENPMAYAVSPTAPRSRPSTVSAAVWLLYLYVALQVIAAILALANMGNFKDAYTEVFKNTDAADQGPTIATASVAIGVVLALLFGVAILVFAIFTGRGRNWARIVVWVVGGLAVCCGGLGMLSQVAGRSMNFGGAGSNAPSQADIQRSLEAHLPGWYFPTATTAGIIGLLAVLAAVVLLALPASNEYFRKRPEPVWEPPLTPGT
jgi:hypothetical protein